MVWISSLVTLSIGAIPRDAIGGTEVCCNTRTRWLEYASVLRFLKVDSGVQMWHGIVCLNRDPHLGLGRFCCERCGILIAISDGIERNCNSHSYYV